MAHDTYISPLSTRYASAQMQHIFSEEFKFRTWRKLWIALARAEHNLGLDVTAQQIAELEAHRDDVNYEVAQQREKQVRHDVMSHVYAYGVQCPNAAGIIHLGATSCYVGDNTDVVILREASRLVLKKCAQVVKNLSDPELSLDDAFKSYEEGVQLLKHCNDTLDKVEKKVMLINDNGETSIF